MVDQWASFPEESFVEGIPFAVGDTPVGVAVVVLSFLRVVVVVHAYPGVVLGLEVAAVC